MDVFTFPFSLSCILGALSFTLYITTMLIIHYHKATFSGSFFILYRAGFFFNLITFLNSFISLRIPQSTCLNCTLSPLFLSHTQEHRTAFPLHLFYGTQLHMGFLQYSLTLLISLNRLTLFIWLNENDQKWRLIAPFSLVAVIFLPFISTWHIYSSDCYFVYLDSVGGFATRSEYSYIPVLSTLITIMTTTTALSAICNVASLIYLSKLGDRIKSAEKRLFYVSIISFLIEGFCLINSNLVNYHTQLPNWVAGVVLGLVPYSSDMITLSQPWILIVCSQMMREKIADIFTSSALSKNEPVSSSMGVSSQHSLPIVTH